VLLTTHRVYRKDGLRHHSALREALAEDYPDEVADAQDWEYSFLRRRWGQSGTEAECLAQAGDRAWMLVAFARDNWWDADAMIRFVEHAGPPDDSDESLLLEATAATAYQKVIAPVSAAYRRAITAAEAAYQKAVTTAATAYQEAITPAEAAYRKATAYYEVIAPAWVAYQKAIATSWAAYQKATAPAWIHAFSDPANRIAIWRD
jgi:hypothetical protein